MSADALTSTLERLQQLAEYEAVPAQVNAVRESIIKRYERIHLQPPSYRACQVCDHGGSSDANAPCSHPETNAQRFPTVAAMRAPGGACGPEAELQYFPGLITF